MRLIRRITCLRDEFGKTIKVKFISYIKKFMNYQKKKKMVPHSIWLEV